MDERRPRSTRSPQRIEEPITAETRVHTVLVTHNMRRPRGSETAFFWLGRLVEAGRTETMYTNPREKLTEDYVTGRFG
jgi:phosphate transport system ATP-binding protein